MFTCSMCKNQHLGDPRVTNGAGKFCDDCFAEMRRRLTETVKRKQEEWDGACIWCGRKVSNPKRHIKPDWNVRTCKPCDARRQWLLECIRRSSHPYEHVCKVEAREAPAREQRELERVAKERAAQAPPAPPAPAPTPAPAAPPPDPRDARLDRLEDTLKKLVQALGGA